MKEQIVQFGTGKFLRGFFDWMVQKLNDETGFDGKVVLIKSTDRKKYFCNNLRYKVYTKGIVKGIKEEKEYAVECVSRIINSNQDWQGVLKCAENKYIKYIVSNTTEAGIIYDEQDTFDKHRTFPGKLTVYLYHRFMHFKGTEDSGVMILPCELIDNNGDKLKEIIIKLSSNWKLSNQFENWINKNCTFFNTMVDSIVTGEMEDGSVVREPFYIWYVDNKIDLFKFIPFDKCGLNVMLVDDIEKYKKVKVRILNGIHTSLVCTAYLKNYTTVREALNDTDVKNFISDMCLKEIIPSIGYDQLELNEYLKVIIERFNNPYIEHKLEDISLNTISKFNNRILPSILDYKEKYNEYPEKLMEVFDGLLKLYKTKVIVDDKQDIINGIKSFEEYLKLVK